MKITVCLRMGMQLKVLSATIVGLTFTTTALQASVITVGASRDTTLYEDAAGGLAGGKGSNIFVGRLGTLGDGLLRRGAIAFDLSAIPDGATITNVSMNITLAKGNGGAQAIDLHRFTKDWGEGASTGGPQGSLASTGDATWTFNFFNTSSWTTPGGDFSPTLSGTQSADFSGPITWNSTPAMVADVQDWVNNPASNFGWILIGNESTLQTAKEFASSNGFSTPPALTVTYSVPEPGACALLIAAGMFIPRRRFRRTR
jgi:hypothetical protein